MFVIGAALIFRESKILGLGNPCRQRKDAAFGKEKIGLVERSSPFYFLTFASIAPLQQLVPSFRFLFTDRRTRFPQRVSTAFAPFKSYLESDVLID